MWCSHYWRPGAAEFAAAASTGRLDSFLVEKQPKLGASSFAPVALYWCFAIRLALEATWYPGLKGSNKKNMSKWRLRMGYREEITRSHSSRPLWQQRDGVAYFVRARRRVSLRYGRFAQDPVIRQSFLPKTTGAGWSFTHMATSARPFN